MKTTGKSYKKELIRISIILLLSVILFFFNKKNFAQSHAQLIEISSRLGSRIDLNTRNYFHLFPKIIDFHYAELFQKDSDEYFFRIHFGNSNNDYDSITNLNTEEILLLKYYIENFESSIDNFFEENILMNEIIDINSYKNQYGNAKKQKYNLILNHEDTDPVFGWIIYADSNELAIKPDKDPYNWEKPEELLIYSCDELKVITIEKNNSYSKGFIAGLMVGVTTGTIIAGISGEGFFISTGIKVLLFSALLGTPAAFIGGSISKSKKIEETNFIGKDSLLYLLAVENLKNFYNDGLDKPPEFFKHTDSLSDQNNSVKLLKNDKQLADAFEKKDPGSRCSFMVAYHYLLIQERI